MKAPLKNGAFIVICMWENIALFLVHHPLNAVVRRGTLADKWKEEAEEEWDEAEAFKDDYPTQKLIQKWIDGEKEHMAWEAQYLNYIDKLGYENFLTAMM